MKAIKVPNQNRATLVDLDKESLAPVVERNIAAIERHRQLANAQRTAQEKVADALTRFAGSVPFIWFHVLWFATWILINQGLLGIRPFDPFPYGLLTTIVSLEAIFLSTFVLVSQNRQMELAERRNDLDLQINLVAEHEITRILALVDSIAKHLQIDCCDDSEIRELKKDIRPEAVLNELESDVKGTHKRTPPQQQKS